MQSTKAFARNLAALTPLPIVFWDERLSTAAVTRALIEADASRARRGEVVDSMAAAYILQGLLDRLGWPAAAGAERRRRSPALRAQGGQPTPFRPPRDGSGVARRRLLARTLT